MDNPREDRVQLDDQIIINELTAICNSLGKIDQNDGVYMKDRDCKSGLRELQRYLNVDSSKHTARCLLGSMNVIRTDFIPLMVQYCDYHEGDLDMFNILLRLCSNLTSSVSILFDQKEDDQSVIQEQLPLKNKLLSNLYSFKEAFSENEEIWSTLNLHLKQNEDDEVTFERLIILIRNILNIPIDANRDLSITSDVHELCLDRMEKSGILSTIIHLASETQKGTEFCFHLTEIIYLMLRDQNPEILATIQPPSTSPKKKLDDSDPDKKRYLELRARSQRDRAKKDRKDLKPHYFRSSLFIIENCRSLSEKPLPVRELLPKREQLDFNRGKVELRKAKNRKPMSSEEFMLYSDTNTRVTKVSYHLKVFCHHFIEKVYNNYMQQIKHNLIQKRAPEEDESYYLWAIHFFISFARHSRLSFDHISETISTNTLHFIQMLVTKYQDKLELEKKKFHDISKMLHLALRAYREMLYIIKTVDPGTEHAETVDKMKKTIFTELEYSTLLLNLFQQYNEPKYSHHYLRDLIKTNHVFLELFESTASDIIVHFLNRYCSPKVIKPHILILKKFDQNDEATNIAILSFMEQIVFKCHNDVILLQASVLICLIDIIENESTSPLHDRFKKLGKHLILKFGAMANRKSWMFQELLFWKAHSDVVEIENTVYPPTPLPPPPPGEEDLDFEKQMEVNEESQPREDSIAGLLEELADSGDENEENLPSVEVSHDSEASPAHSLDKNKESLEATNDIERLKAELADLSDENEESLPEVDTIEGLREELADSEDEEWLQRVNSSKGLKTTLDESSDENEENLPERDNIESLQAELASSSDESDTNEQHTPLIVPTETKEVE